MGLVHRWLVRILDVNRQRAHNHDALGEALHADLDLVVALVGWIERAEQLGQARPRRIFPRG